MPMTYNEKKEYLKGFVLSGVTLARLESREKFFVLTEEERQKMDFLKLQRQKIAEEISLVKTPVLKELLEQRYILNTPLRAVGEALGYSTRHIQRLHKAAVEEFEVL